MIQERYRPGPPLAAFIHTLWLFDGYVPQHPKERLMPDGCMSLVINLHQRELRVYDQQGEQAKVFPCGVLSGAQSRYFVLDAASQASVIAVYFKAGGAYRFLGCPAGELHNAHVAVGDLWGAQGLTLRERLLEAKSTQGKFRLLEEFLKTRLTCAPLRHPAIAYAVNRFQSSAPRSTVAEVTDEIGMSAKSFIQAFRTEVGMTPKLFCRLQRFQQILKCIAGGNRMEFLDAALACGYFDQAHFIHDFRAFSGLNPTAYLSTNPRHHNHVPLIG